MRLRNKTCILDVKIMKCIFMRNVQSSYSSENIKPEAYYKRILILQVVGQCNGSGGGF